VPQGKGVIDEIRMTDGSEEKPQTPDAKFQKKSKTAAASEACIGVGVIAFKTFFGVWTVAFVIWARRAQSFYFTSRLGKCRAKAKGAQHRTIRIGNFCAKIVVHAPPRAAAAR
jgi:hypothetical protein